MPVRFNPPPDWPRFPEGWTAPPGWQPDPSWPSAPDGWRYWRREAPQWMAIAVAIATLVGIITAGALLLASPQTSFPMEGMPTVGDPAILSETPNGIRYIDCGGPTIIELIRGPRVPYAPTGELLHAATQACARQARSDAITSAVFFIVGILAFLWIIVYSWLPLGRRRGLWAPEGYR